MFRTVLLILLLLQTPPTVGAAAQESATKPSPSSSISVENDAGDDDAIARRVRAIFEEIGAFDDVRVQVRSGVVILRGTALDEQSIAEAVGLAGRVQGVVTVRSEIEQETAVAERLTPAVDRLRQRLTGIVAQLPVLGVGLLVFLAFLLLGFWLAARSFPWDRMAPNAFVADLIRQIVRLVFAAVGVVVALDLIGATALLGTILGAAGIVGLAIGFAVRDTIENYIASILLSVRQPFRPNDFVRIDSYEGNVIRLTSRATVLMTFDGNHVRIPNATVFKGTIVNYSMNPERRFDIRMGVDPNANLQRAAEIGIETLRGLDFVLDDPGPDGVVEEIGDSTVTLQFFAWIDQEKTDFLKARGEAIRLVKHALEEAGIALPEPAYRLLVEGDGRPAAGSAPPASPRPAAEPESAEPADASKQDDIQEKVEEERARLKDKDLLDPSAPTE